MDDEGAASGDSTSLISTYAYNEETSHSERYQVSNNDPKMSLGISTTGYQYGNSSVNEGLYGTIEDRTYRVQDYANIGVVGSCPACSVGVLDDHFTCLGIALAIFCFPLGILCCLGTRQRRCSNCGAVFG